jgi:hypothetical protein
MRALIRVIASALPNAPTDFKDGEARPIAFYPCAEMAIRVPIAIMEIACTK